MIGRKQLCSSQRASSTRRTRTRGQALVEFALSATLIFFLLCAAVDLGLIFFAVQGLHNAALEGATYGSRWLITNGSNQRVLDVVAIRDRARKESGTQGGIGFVNLLDLNGNGMNDDAEAGVIDQYITVQALKDVDLDGDPLNDGTAPGYTPCTDASIETSGACFAYVQVFANHNLVFPLSPVFTDTLRLRSYAVMPIRDSYSRGSGPVPTPSQTGPTPTPAPSEIIIELVAPTNTTLGSTNDTKFEFKVYDRSKGTSDGIGISNVDISIVHAGTTINTKSDSSPKYCAFGNSNTNCGKMGNSMWNNLPNSTTLTVNVTATGSGGGSAVASKSFAFTVSK